MCFVEMKCHHCGAVFQLHFEGKALQKCPHCLSSIPEKGLIKLLDAMHCLEEVNKDFRDAHSVAGKSLFQAEIHNYYVPLNKIDV